MIAYKVQLHPNNLQTTRLFQFAGAARYAYNWSINQQKAAYTAGRKFINDFELCKQFTQHKRLPGNEWMYTISDVVLKHSVRDCCNAYKRFFKHQAKYPRYKRRKDKQSFYQDTAKIQFTATHVRIEMLSPSKRKHNCWVKLAESNRIPINSKYYNPRITYDGLNWWVSVAVDTTDRKPIIAKCSEPIGIDLGVKELAVCSDGTVYRNINKTAKVRKLKKKQRRLQRQVSRKYLMNKEGNSYRKTCNIRKSEKFLRKLYQRLTHIRQSYSLQIIQQIVQRQPSCIVLEDLNVSGMLKNRHLSRAIQEQTFYYFRATLERYAKKFNIAIKYADRFYPSSKRCSNCGNIKTDLKLSDRIYECGCCGIRIDRDLNAAKNLQQLA